jgi:hypothetical protein
MIQREVYTGKVNAHLVSIAVQTPHYLWISRGVVEVSQSDQKINKGSWEFRQKHTRQNDSFALALEVSTPNSPSLRFSRVLIVEG